jgi:TRAP-type C4-dicarboxylate transport system permease small subunit
MNLLRTIDVTIETLGEVSLALSGLCIALLLLIGPLDTVGTQFFGIAVPSSIELQEVFEVLLIFGALAAVQRRQAHIVIDLFNDAFSPAMLRFLNVFSLTATAVLLGLFTWYAGVLAARSIRVMEVSPGAVSFPLYPVKILFCAACLIALLETLRQLARALVRKPAVPPAAVAVTHF